MSIGLPSDLEQFVRQELASGRYASPEEVISEGLRRMRDGQQEYDRWRAEIARRVESLERGEGIRLNDHSLRKFLDDIAAEVHEEVAGERGEPA